MAGLMKKMKELWTPPEDELDYEYEQESEDESNDMPKYNGNRSKVDPQNNKVVNIHAKAQLQVVLFRPEKFGEDTRVIADELMKTNAVVLNLEQADKEVSTRVLDFLSGVAYANNGKIKKLATSTFIITPYNVGLAGDDLLDELENNGVYF